MKANEPFTPSIQDLDTALRAGTARFASSRIFPADPTSLSVKRLDRKLDHSFAAFPDIRIGGQAITHERSGLTFSNLHINSSEYLVGCGKMPGHALRPDTPVEITTGNCFFGSDALVGYIDGSAFSLTEPSVLAGLNGTIEHISIDERIHVSEAETIVRLSSFIRALSSQFEAPFTVRFHEPLAEYELYGIDLYVRGLLSRELLQVYLDAVRRRRPFIQHLLRDQFDISINLQFLSPLDWIDQLDALRLDASNIPAALYTAAEQQDALWGALLKARPCGRLTDLNYLSYAYFYFAQSQRTQAMGSQHIIVEDPSETPIYTNAREVQSAVGIDLTATCGFYVHPKVVITDTAFKLADHVLYDCREGTDPRNVKLALQPYGTAARQLLQLAYGDQSEQAQRATHYNQTQDALDAPANIEYS